MKIIYPFLGFWAVWRESWATELCPLAQLDVGPVWVPLRSREPPSIHAKAQRLPERTKRSMEAAIASRESGSGDLAALCREASWEA